MSENIITIVSEPADTDLVTITLNGNAEQSDRSLIVIVLTHAEIKLIRAYLMRQFPEYAPRLRIQSRLRIIQAIHEYYGLPEYVDQRLA